MRWTRCSSSGWVFRITSSGRKRVALTRPNVLERAHPPASRRRASPLTLVQQKTYVKRAEWYASCFCTACARRCGVLSRGVGGYMEKTLLEQGKEQTDEAQG